MNAIIRKITIACLALLPLTASAQTDRAALDDQFAATVKALAGYVTSSNIGNYASGYHKIYYFSIPKATNKDLERFSSAITEASANALTAMMKKPESIGGKPFRIYFGEPANNKLTFNSDIPDAYNVVIFRDSSDKPRRYVYGLQWRTDGNKLTGDIFSLYGGEEGVWPIKPSVSSQDIDKMVKEAQNDVRFTEVPKSSSDFLTILSSYSGTFRGCAHSYLLYNDKPQIQRSFLQTMTVLADKTKRLCKEYGHLLDKDDRGIARNELSSLSKMCQGDYLNLADYFTVALNQISK